MNRIKLNLDKSKKYVIACSFGPDSMALLDAAIKEKLNIVVAHVNYRKRDVSLFEQQQLEKYCSDRKIKCYVLDLLGEKNEGNFQDWARKKRYEFFKQIAEKEEADAVLVAHQQDDVIETYLMQKKRKNIAKTPGISANIEIFGVKIIRPLLAYSKAYLLNYDEENLVPFSIDESNLTDHYSRNKIRHSIVEKLSPEERAKVLKEINEKQTKKIEVKSKYTLDEFLEMEYEELIHVFGFFMNKVKEHRNISGKFVEEIKKAFKNKTNHRVDVSDSVILELDYEEIFFINKNKLHDYRFEVRGKLNNELFDIDFSKGAEDRGIKNIDDYFIVQNVHKNEEVIIKNYKTTIRRLFIDWKMPLFLREAWPGIYNKNEDLIYLPRYRKDFKDDHKSKLKINTKYFQEF